MDPSALLSLLLQTLRKEDSFTEGARKLASFIRKTEERFSAPEVLGAILNGSCPPRMREYILFSFLDTSRADFDMLEQARPLRQTRRLIHRATWYSSTLSAAECELATVLYKEAGIQSVDDVVIASRTIATLLLQLSQNEPLDNNKRRLLALLLSTEAKILKIRSEWLSDHVDSYDMKAIARLMPLLTTCDEKTCVLLEITDRISSNGSLGRAVLSFEYAMKSDSYEKWKKKAGQEPSLRSFLEMMEVQRTRCIPVNYLIPVATLSRRLHQADTNPLTWISHSLSCCTSDGFRMDIGHNISTLKKLLSMYSITPVGTLISGSFSSGGYLQWVQYDMLTLPPQDGEQEPSPKEIVMRCLNNDALLLRLLENPKFASIPGLVEKIAYNSRSLSVLQKIATTRELHTGHANNGVPCALLKNPTHIPFSQIRQFINTRYVTLFDLKDLMRNPFGIRREIHQEIKIYIDQRYR